MIVYDIQQEIYSSCNNIGLNPIEVRRDMPYLIEHGGYLNGEYLFNDELFDERDVYNYLMISQGQPLSIDKLIAALEGLDECGYGRAIYDDDVPMILSQISRSI